MIDSIFVNYCDDIRFERGDKISLIGVYGPNMIVPTFPITLPRLCMFLQITSKAGSAITEPITIEVLSDETVIQSAESPADQFPLPYEGDGRARIACHIELAALTLEKPCELWVRVKYARKSFKTYTLKVTRS